MSGAPGVRGDAFCIVPWIHLEVVPEGNAKICCVAKEAIRDKGRPMSVAESSLEEIRRSPYMRSVREALADGRKIPVCGYCWDQEKRGESSQRQLWNAYAATPADPGPRTANRAHAARIARYLEGCEETADLAALRRDFVAFTRDLDASRGQSLERSVPELREMLTLFG